MDYNKINELKERFIKDYSKWDKRLLNIKRNRIDVKDCGNEVEGAYHLTCVYYGKRYAHTYFIS